MAYLMDDKILGYKCLHFILREVILTEKIVEIRRSGASAKKPCA